MPGRILGLDLSPAHCGVCVLNEHGLPLLLRTIDMPLKGKQIVVDGKKASRVTEAQRAERNVNMANEIIGISKTWRILEAAIEDYAYAQVNQAHRVGESVGVAKSQFWLALRKTPSVVGPTMARKAIFGPCSPTPIKAETIAVVTKLLEPYGKAPDSEHSADAWVVAWWKFKEAARRRRQLEV